MDNERNIRRTILPNGLTILTEKMDHIRSVAMGVWIRAGSRHEMAEVNGISHFVEHMVFKGTKSRSAQRIAREVDAIGGNLDAFTGKETVCFNIKVLDEHVPVALDVLSDLVLNPIFASDEISRERGVILEEIKMDEDNPDYLVHEIFTQAFWKDHPLGKPILGTKETVKRFERDTLCNFYGQRFHGGNMIFSAAGNIDHDAFVEQVTRRFESLPPGESLTAVVPPKTAARIILKNKKALEQVQLCLGVPAPAIADESRYVTLVLNTILGGGMSSRLFRTVLRSGDSSRPTGHGAVPPPQDGDAARRRAAPRKGSIEGQPAALARKLHVAHVKPGAPADALQLFLRHAGDPRQGRVHHRRSGTGHGQPALPAGSSRRNAARPPRRRQAHAQPAGVLKTALSAQDSQDSLAS